MNARAQQTNRQTTRQSALQTAEQTEHVFRNELKFEINEADACSLRLRLKRLLRVDPYAQQTGGSYEIRSLYFDTPTNKALREKLDGVSVRDKYRLRMYNHDTGLIQLEKKCKRNNLGYKMKARLSAEQVQAIIDGDIAWMATWPDALVVDLYHKMIAEQFAPKTIVDYTREPFVYRPGNVRVTLDSNIRTGMRGVDFLNPQCITVPAGQSHVILEVKWDEFLPDVVQRAVSLRSRRAGAFSKYAQCRIYG